MKEIGVISFTVGRYLDWTLRLLLCKIDAHGLDYTTNSLRNSPKELFKISLHYLRKLLETP